ncbi:MAG: TonB-dependent receptor [Leptospiraceae bacterium]|nr:TonB-dependent receptor [Leptospiraceae bacterium]
MNPTKTQKQMINAYRMSTVLNLVLKGFFSLLILFPFDSLKAETKILIGSIRSLNATESKEIEALIQKEFSESSDPFVFYIKPMESINKGIIEARTGGYQIYSEIYYRNSDSFPPDVYIASFDPQNEYLYDVISETTFIDLPAEIEISEDEFQERPEDIIKRTKKKYLISHSVNPSQKIIRDNIIEGFKNPEVRNKLQSFRKAESQKEKSEDAFAYLKDNFETATRSAQKLEDLPVTVGVIRREEIHNYNYRTLVEALKFQPGIMVSEPGNGEVGHHFYQRGLLGNEYTKILLNGIPLTPSVVQGMPINEMLYLKHAESIEVVYGPASAVYGSDAFAGVINIKTVPKKENRIHLGTHVGEYGYLNFNFNVAQAVPLLNDHLLVQAYGLKSNRSDQNIKKGYSDSYYAEKYYQRNNEFGSRVNYFSELPSSNSSYGTSITFKKFSFFFDQMKRTDHSSIGQQSSFYAYNDSGAIWSDTITRFAAKNSFDLGKFTFNTNLSYNQYRLDNSSNYNLKFEKSPLYKFMGSDDVLFEQTAIYKLMKEVEILGGFSYQYSGAFPKTNDLKLPFNENFYKPFSSKLPPSDPDLGNFGNNPLRFQNKGGFLQTTINIQNTTIIAGARYDKNSLYEGSFNPRIALIYKLTPKSSLRTSYTEGFRGPPIYLSYNSIATGSTSSGITYLFVPNKNLQPEKLKSYELGWRYLYSKISSAEIVLFHNSVKNKFNSLKVRRDEYLYPYSTQSRVDTFGNIGRSELTGIDIIFLFKELYKPIHLNLSLSNSFAKGVEYLSPDYSKVENEIENYILDQYDPKRNKINNYRSVPRRMNSLRISSKFFERWFLALDLINTEGWYSKNIRTKSQYDTAEFNPTYNIYYSSNKMQGYTIIDFNTFFEINQYFRLVSKITNLTNEVISGKGAYDGSNNLDIHPQYRRNVYAGFEVNNAW